MERVENWRLEIGELAVRELEIGELEGWGFEGTAEGEDNVEETGTGAGEDEAGVFTAPEALSSRTIASTIALSWVSSIKIISNT